MNVIGIFTGEFSLVDGDNNEIASRRIQTSVEKTLFTQYYDAEVAGAASSYEGIPFGQITSAGLVVLHTSQEVTVRLDGDDNIIFPVKGFFVLESDTGITQLDVKNAGTDSAVIQGYILGT